MTLSSDGMSDGIVAWRVLDRAPRPRRVSAHQPTTQPRPSLLRESVAATRREHARKSKGGGNAAVAMAGASCGEAVASAVARARARAGDWRRNGYRSRSQPPSNVKAKDVECKVSHVM